MGMLSGLQAIFATGKVNEMTDMLEDYKKCNEYYTVPKKAREILVSHMENTEILEKICSTDSKDSRKAEKNSDAIKPNIEETKSVQNEQQSPISKTEKSEGFERED